MAEGVVGSCEFQPEACFLCQKTPEETGVDKVKCDFCDIVACSGPHKEVHLRTRRSNKGKNSPSVDTVMGGENDKWCWPFRIGRHPLKGNVMIASRDIKAGKYTILWAGTGIFDNF